VPQWSKWLSSQKKWNKKIATRWLNLQKYVIHKIWICFILNQTAIPKIMWFLFVNQMTNPLWMNEGMHITKKIKAILSTLMKISLNALNMLQILQTICDDWKPNHKINDNHNQWLYIYNIDNIEFKNIDLVLNESKSQCIRIGKRWHEQCVPLRTSNGIIPRSNSVTYLGVNVLAAAKFSCCFDKPKSNFYSSFNAIYSKLGKINNAIVTLNLISSIALPCLLFAM